MFSEKTRCFFIFHVFAVSSSHYFHPLQVLSLLVCHPCTVIILNMAPLFCISLTLHGAHAVATRDNGSVKYKAKSCWKLAITSLKQCSFSSLQKSDMISPKASILNFTKSENKVARKKHFEIF